MKKFKSLRTKYILIMTGVVTTAVMVMTLVTSLLNRSAMIEQAGIGLLNLALSQANIIGNDLEKQVDLLIVLSQNQLILDRLIAANSGYSGEQAVIQAQIDQLDAQWRKADTANNNADPLVQSVLSDALTAELVSLKNSFPEHVEIFVTDRYGASVASTGRTSDYNQADEPWWQIAFNNGQGDIYIGEPEFDESSQTYALNIAVPVKNGVTGEVVGILRSTYNIQGFTTMLQSIQFGSTGQSDLILPGGGIIGSEATKKSVTPVTLLQMQETIGTYGMMDYQNARQAISLAKVRSSGARAAVIENLDWNLVASQKASEVLQPVTRQTIILAASGFLMILVAISFSFLFSPTLIRPILRLTKVANQLAEGDLSVQAKVTTKDEIGQLADSFNNMADQIRYNLSNERAQRKHIQETIDRYVEFVKLVMRGKLGARLQIADRTEGQDDPLVFLGKSLNEMTESLHRMIAQTTEAAANLSSAATEILAATTQQASGATEQSAAITQTTSTVNEVKTISEQSSLRLKDIASASQRTVEVARSGQKAVQEMIESMTQIKERVEAIAENTLALSEQTQQIGEIITTVNEIAAQSNILALNASVEAARAGEHGKGFAVVAMEVRNLAEQSKQATAQVRTILSEIQKATNSTVMATEEGAKGVDAGVTLAAQTREAIEKLGSAVNDATQVAMQVVAGGQQLQTGIEQIAMAIQQINQVTIQSLASTRQTEKSAQNLNELAHHLNENVTQYQL